MTRMVKVILAVAVVILTCSLVIGSGSSTAKAASQKEKMIKIWVNENTGKIKKVKLIKDDGSEQDPDREGVGMPCLPDCKYSGTIVFHKKSNPTCILVEAGGYYWEVCW